MAWSSKVLKIDWGLTTKVWKCHTKIKGDMKIKETDPCLEKPIFAMSANSQQNFSWIRDHFFIERYMGRNKYMYWNQC